MAIFAAEAAGVFTHPLQRGNYPDHAGKESARTVLQRRIAEGTCWQWILLLTTCAGMALAIFRATHQLRPARQSPNGSASMRFLLALREVDADLHCVMIPDLPGCRAAGRNAQQAILYARRAIDEHCRALALEGEPMPEPLPLERHTPLPDLFAEATWTSVDVPIEQYFVH